MTPPPNVAGFCRWCVGTRDQDPAEHAGRKSDAGKSRWDLVPPAALADVVDVLTHGAGKYAPDNWRQVPNARPRYFAAAMRHTWAWWRGEATDPDSGLPHLAHAVCCLLFLAELDQGKGTK